MRDSFDHNISNQINYRIVIVTLDSHNARPCERALLNMLPDFEGLKIDIFAAAEWDEDPETFIPVREAIAQADIIVINLGIIYLLESFTIQAPRNKLKDKK